MKEFIELKVKFLKGLAWVLNNGYEIALSAVCFCVATEILGTWACWAVLFGSFGVWGLKKQGVIKPLNLGS